MKKSRQDKLTEEAQGYDSDEEYLRNRKKICQVLSRYPAAYLGEIAWEAGLTDYQVKLYLTQMYHEEYVREEKVTDEGNPRLIARVPEMSSKGQGGQLSFARKKWYSLTAKGRRKAE